MKIFKWLVALWVTLALAACGGEGRGTVGSGTGTGGSSRLPRRPFRSRCMTKRGCYDLLAVQLAGNGQITALKDAKVVVAGKKVSFAGDAKDSDQSCSPIPTDSTGTATIQISSGPP